MVARVALLLSAGLALAGCPQNGDTPIPDAGPPDSSPDLGCGPNLKAHKTACVPILDDCPESHVPIPGGGCERVGVEVCTVDGSPGIKGPPDWKCKRVGSADQCATGWIRNRDGWCEPILPEAPCSKHTMEVIGEKECQPVGECGDPPFGKIVTTPSTLFVDAAHGGSDADGTKAKPYPTIGQALVAAPTGGHVAVAAGTYNEDLSIKKKVRLEGRCAELVTVVGQSQPAAVLATAALELRGLTVTGFACGILADPGAKKVAIDEVIVRDCGGPGIDSKETDLVIDDTLLADNTGLGLSVQDASLELHRSTVRDTVIDLDVDASRLGGLHVENKTTTSTVEINDCVVVGNSFYGVALMDTKATLRRSVVRDTARPTAKQAAALCAAPSPNDPECENNLQNRGIGIAAFTERGAAQLTIQDCLIAGNSQANVAVAAQDVIIERSVVKDCLLPTSFVSSVGISHFGSPGDGHVLRLTQTTVIGNAHVGATFKHGILDRVLIRGTKSTHWSSAFGILMHPTDAGRPSLTMHDSLIDATEGLAAFLAGADATLERTAVVGSRGQRQEGAIDADDGSGIKPAVPTEWQRPTKLILKHCLVAQNQAYGVRAFDSHVTLERSVVKDSVEDDLTGLAGTGIVATYRGRQQPTLTLRRSLVQNNRATGLELKGAEAIVERSVIRGTLPVKKNGAWGEGIYATIAHGQPTNLTLTDSVVADNHTTGLLLLSSKATVQRSRIQGTKAEDASGSFGDGIAVSPATEGQSAWLHLADSEVAASARAGLVFFSASGKVERSLFRHGALSVALELGAEPVVGPRNVFEENSENRMTFGQGLTSPAPILPPPVP